MASYTTRPAVRDSFDDDDASDDVDDEVFIRDGRNGYKVDEERGVKRPLMAPRRKQKQAKLLTDTNERPRWTCKMLLIPCCYGLLALAILLGLITLTVVVINYLPLLHLDRIRFWKIRSQQRPVEKVVVPCTDFVVRDVWHQSFPKLNSETPIRLSDVNKDGVLDILFGYGNGADGRNVPDFVCYLYFNRQPPCLGGIIALDGQSGETIWQHWTHRPVFSLDCVADVTEDGVNDCLVGGKGGLLHVVNGHDGSLLWHLEDGLQQQEMEPILDIYSAQFVRDIDGDGFADVVAAHTASDNSGTSVKGHLLLVSGRAGRLLRMIDLPGGSESYYAPQILVRPDGQEQILFGTGGTADQTWGGINFVPLSSLATAEKLISRAIVGSDSRGAMSPAVFTDVNHDGVEDIIVSLFNSTVVAVDGHTFVPMWNHSFPNSQTFSPPTPGYYNDDDVPDFLVKYQNGPDFPLYYFSQVNILDGKTGAPLLDHPVVDSVGSQMGGLSVGVEGSGNDWFLYWTSDCAGYEGSQTPFSFSKGSSLVAQSKADLCRLRFNSTMSVTLWALNQHVEPPGLAIYSSEWKKSIEYNKSADTENEVSKYLEAHPDFWRSHGMPVNPISASRSSQTVQDSEKKPGTDRSYSPYERDMFQSTHASDAIETARLNGPSGVARNREEVEEMRERDYSRPRPQSVGRHRSRRPQLGWPQQRTWMEDEDKRYQESPPIRKDDTQPEGGGQDYDLSESEGGDMYRLTGDYIGPLNGLRNERSGAQETATNFMQAIHDEPLPETRSKRSSDEAKNIVKTKSTKASEDSASNSSNILKGIYPITSTGTLAPALSESGIDLVFISYWIPPSEGVKILYPKDIECIKQALTRSATDDSGKYSGMDQETLETTVMSDCVQYRSPVNGAPNSETDSGYPTETHPSFVIQSATTSRSRGDAYPALALRLGQLTVYRLNLECRCRKVRPQYEMCAKVLPFSQQSWPSFMGHDGKGYFSPHH